LTEQPQQGNQTASVPPALEQPATTQPQQEQQNPFKQLGQAISNMFGGGK
jgi:hypothetical protein